MIEVKKCSKCNFYKNISEFYGRSRSLKGVRASCKLCDLEYALIRGRTKDGLITKMFSNQRRRSKHRGHNLPSYTKDEFYKWVYNKEIFHKLYNTWKDNNYKQNLVPSVDRIDDNIGYSIGNIQLVTWEENNHKGSNDVKICKRINKSMPQRKVSCYTLDGDYISSFISISEAHRKTGIHTGNISSTCKGYRKYAGEMVWRYTE